MTCEQESNVLVVDLDQVENVLDVMRMKESTIYARSSDIDELNALWRQLLIEWMYFVVDYCNLQRQSVGAAAFYLDVAMSRNLIHTREQFQLAAATSLQLSLKTFDTAVIKLEKLVKLGRGSFTEDDIIDMELKILRALEWRLHPTTSYCFLRQYERLLPSTVTESTRHMIDEVTKLVSELALLDHRYNGYPQSVVAYAAMLMAMELIDSSNLPIQQRQCFVMRMSTIARYDSKSSLVLRVFDELRETLDESPKLKELIQSLNTARKQTENSIPTLQRKTKDVAGSEQSPRHVMARLSSNSYENLREMRLSIHDA